MTDDELLDLRGKLIKKLTVSDVNFNSVTSLSSEFGVTEGDARYALMALERECIVRRPYNPKNNELSLYRLSARGFTPKEKRRLLFNVLSNSGERKVKPECY